MPRSRHAPHAGEERYKDSALHTGAGAAAAVPATLEITFTGLFMFVPSADETQLVVLLPRTGVLSEGNRVHQHHALLSVDREYLPKHPLHPTHHPDCDKPTKRVEKGGHGHEHAESAAAAADCDHKMDTHERIPFGRYRLAFGGLATDGTEVVPPPAAVDLTAIAGKLDPRQISEDPLSTVWAQVVLPPASVAMRADDKASWKVGTGKHDLSHQIVWKTSVPTGTAEIDFTYLGGGAAGSIMVTPKTPGGTIQLLIEHLPVEKDRHKGKKCCDAPHFLAYYDLFGDSTEGPIPVLREEPDRVDDKFTCMTSQGRI